MDVINKFLHVLKVLSPHPKNTLKENETKVLIELDLSIEETISLVNDEILTELADSNTVNLNITVKGHSHTRKQFIEKTSFFSKGHIGEIRLNFNKDQYVKNSIVFFYLSSFCETIQGKTPTFLKCDGIRKRLVFLPINKAYNNDFIHLCPLEDFEIYKSTENIEDSPRHLYERHVYVLEKLSSIEDFDFPLPEEIFISEGIEEENLKNALEYSVFRIITKLLSNKHHESFTFTGYQTIDLIYSSPFSPKNIKTYYSLYEFIYDKEKYFDKIQIARNVITLYLNDKENSSKIDDNIERINETVVDHFSAYIQGSIEEFFNSRKDIVKEAYESGLTIREHSDKITQQINLIIFGSLTAVLSGVILYSRGGKWLLVSILFLHAIYFIVSYLVNKSNYDTRGIELESSFDTYGKEFTTLRKEKIEAIKEDHIKKPLNKFEQTYKYYCRLVLIMTAFVIILSGVVAITFPSVNDGSDSNKQPKTEISNKNTN